MKYSATFIISDIFTLFSICDFPLFLYISTQKNLPHTFSTTYPFPQIYRENVEKKVGSAPTYIYTKSVHLTRKDRRTQCKHQKIKFLLLFKVHCFVIQCFRRTIQCTSYRSLMYCEQKI